MTSPTRKRKARRAMKSLKSGRKRKRLVEREGSTLSAEKLFAVKGE